jgi:protein-S-isoprenylcysteine O-methyltransferase Ste14
MNILLPGILKDKNEIQPSRLKQPVRSLKNRKMKTNKILPPRVFQIEIIAIVAIHFLIPVLYMYNSLWRFVGLIPIVFGAYLNIYSDWLIKKHNTTIKPFEKPTALIEKGTFGYSRNPIYLGMVLIVLGGTLISGSVLALLTPFIFAIVLHYKYILEEERILCAEFGNIYLDYSKKVRRWF